MKSTTRPDYIAYLVEEPRREGGKPFFHRVGSVWSNKGGESYTLVMPPGLSVTGRVMLLPPRMDEE